MVSPRGRQSEAGPTDRPVSSTGPLLPLHFPEDNAILVGSLPPTTVPISHLQCRDSAEGEPAGATKPSRAAWPSPALPLWADLGLFPVSGGWRLSAGGQSRHLLPSPDCVAKGTLTPDPFKGRFSTLSPTWLHCPPSGWGLDSAKHWRCFLLLLLSLSSGRGLCLLHQPQVYCGHGSGRLTRGPQCPPQ